MSSLHETSVDRPPPLFYSSLLHGQIFEDDMNGAGDQVEVYPSDKSLGGGGGGRFRVGIFTEEKREEENRGSVFALSAGAFTTTLLVMVR
jgi:hypothetical protein